MPYAPEGNPAEAEVVFIGEAPAAEEMRQGRPLCGMAGGVFDNCLAPSGFSRSRAYLTNLYDWQVKKDKQKNILNPEGEYLWKSRTGLTGLSQPSIDRLAIELKLTKANVIVPMGNPALEAVCSLKGITKWRGSIVPATIEGSEGRKCLPTIHPAMALHGSELNRYLIRRDFKKAKREALIPQIIRPPYEFRLNPTFDECVNYLRGLRNVSHFTSDIEVEHRQVSRIAFSTRDFQAISIPYGHGDWALEKEVELWRETAITYDQPKITKIFQNGLFDIWFLLVVHNVYVRPPYEDTMILHHIMYPDFAKGLAFLTSLYTDQPYYKEMVKHGAIEKEGG